MTLEDCRRDTEFAEFVKTWRLKQRCPSEMVEWLRTRGLTAAAEAAAWAATEPDKPQWCDPAADEVKVILSGPMPMNYRGGTYNSWSWSKQRDTNCCDGLPDKVAGLLWQHNRLSGRTFMDAVLSLLELWPET